MGGEGRISSGIKSKTTQAPKPKNQSQETKVEDAKAEEGNLCGINDRLDTKKRERGRDKWICRGAHKKLKHAEFLWAHQTQLLSL